MERKGWYLVVYDIADQRRLQRVHRHIKKHGIAAQRSVFFVRGSEKRLNRLLDELTEIIKASEDDLRAYPINDPKHVWSFGVNPLAAAPLIVMDRVKTQTQNKKRSGNRFLRLLGL